MQLIKYGLLHNHTDNSVRDSVMSVKVLVERAKELGSPAVALTDHGSMTGYIEFYNQCEKSGIKPIIGVEAYVEESTEGKRHLILMAKDNIGLTAISKAVSRSNERVSTVGKLSYPRMNKEIIRSLFGPEGVGHGHVIATSACVSGILAGLTLQNTRLEKKAESIIEKQKGLESPISEGFIKNTALLEDYTEMSKDLTSEINLLKKASSKSTLTLEKRVKSAKTDEAREEAKRILEAALSDKQLAAKELDAKKAEKEKIEAEIKRLRPILAKQKQEVARYEKLQFQIDEIMKDKLSDDDIEREILNEAKWYKGIFGEDFYIELQYHGMKEEKSIMPKLMEYADLLGIKTVLSNDAHIAKKSGDDILARAIIRSTMFDTWEEPDRVDGEVYIKTDDELIEALSKIIPKENAQKALENIGEITNKCSISLSKENHYPKYDIPEGYSSCEDYLRHIAREGVTARYGEGFRNAPLSAAVCAERLAHELDVICSMGYADYLLIVQDFLRYARSAGKLDLADPSERELALTFDIPAIEEYTKGMPGEAIGPGRGSAAGSLVCYLIGITNIDPLKYGLLFERFLNPERVSMPDIDVDISKDFRSYVIAYVKHKYGDTSVCGIMTKNKLSGRSALRTAARVLGIQKKADSTCYLSLYDAIVRKVLEYSDDELNISLLDIRDKVMAAFTDNRIALEIYRYALLIDGATDQISQHASGIIVSDGNPVSDYVPLVYSSSNDIMLSQCDMVQAEDIGLLKMDFLGLKNLSVITECLRLIKRERGIDVDMDRIPFEKDVFSEIFAKAKTNSIFQFESDGMKQMLKSFKPDSIEDLVLLVAMFRPGPLQYLDSVIKVKQGVKSLTYLTKELEPILKSTYGSITYQEQVQEIFKSLAGYSLGQADLVRRAMSKKKEAVLKAEREAFVHGDEKRNIPGCVKNGISEKTANTLFDQMTDFAKYAFNKSHAACYAVVAYQTAYLKYHYPAEYMTAVLNYSEADKYSGLIADLNEMRIKVLPPSVNYSEMFFTLNKGEIRYGLGNIKGLGSSAQVIVDKRKRSGRKENYSSFTDFLFRVMPGKGLLEPMIYSGALDEMSSSRTALMDLLPETASLLKKHKDIMSKLDIAYSDTQKEELRNKLDSIEKLIFKIIPDETIIDIDSDILTKEKELLGAFISRHPLDVYGKPSDYKAKSIAEALATGNYKTAVTGMISGIAIKKRKSDGAEMAFFKLSDKTADINVCCFAEAYRNNSDKIKDGAVVKISGNITEDGDEKKLIVKDIIRLVATKNVIMCYVKDIGSWMSDVKDRVEVYTTAGGNPVVVYDLFLDEMRRTDLIVSASICEDEDLNCKLSEMKL